MKKLFAIVFLSIICIFPLGVYAKDGATITTLRGVTVDKVLYDKMVNVYSEHYVETLSQEEFDNLSENIDSAVVKEYIVEDSNARGSYFASGAKAVHLIKAGQWVTLTGTWSVVPNVHSYDVIAVRLSGCSLNGSFTFKQTYVSSGNLYYVTNGTDQYFSNGFGSSALLQYGTDNEYSLTFRISGSGTIYGTYQHAAQSVTLNDSLNYGIGAGGHGNVIRFAAGVALKYDQMNGVDLAV